MSSKQIVQNLLRRLPEDVSLHEVARQIEFVAGICEGFESHDRERHYYRRSESARVHMGEEALSALA